MVDVPAEEQSQPRLRRTSNWSRVVRCTLIMAAVIIVCFLAIIVPLSATWSVETWSDAGHQSAPTPTNDTLQSIGMDWQLETSIGDQEDNFSYNSHRDVIVFLHMQKTSGSVFGHNLVRNAIGFPSDCRRIIGLKQFNCTTASGLQWLFSRYANGWLCGLHADWTELHYCVPGMLSRLEGRRRRRRYVYITMLRHPVQRYLSEWKHVQRGGTWKTARLRCNGRSPTRAELPFCFSGDDWPGVSLDDFLTCPYNLANNRQTRMLANLSVVHCYNLSAISDPLERDRLLLHSAMQNLRDMVFFGLTERQLDSQLLFERTFNVRFRVDFVQRNNTTAQRTDVTEDQLRHIETVNRLDVQLYRYAVQIFDERVRRARPGDQR